MGEVFRQSAETVVFPRLAPSPAVRNGGQEKITGTRQRQTSGKVPPRGSTAELLGGHQGSRYRRGGGQSREPGDRRKNQRVGVHRDQSRRAGASHERRGREV